MELVPILRAQLILGKRGKPRPKTHEFAFTGMIRCGECGSMITAEEIFRKNKTDGRIRHYVYYHCTKKKPGVKCSQPFIEVKALEQQVNEVLSHLTISEKFKNWAIKYLRLAHEQEMKEQSSINISQQTAFNNTHQQLDKLLDLKLRELISDDEHQAKKKQLLTDQSTINEKIAANKYRTESWLELAEKTFDFAHQARYWFQNGTLQEKRMVLQTIGGSNLLLKDKQLIIEPNELLSILINRPKNSSWQGVSESNASRKVLETLPHIGAPPEHINYSENT